jgi:hypothetical protein
MGKAVKRTAKRTAGSDERANGASRVRKHRAKMRLWALSR